MPPTRTRLPLFVAALLACAVPAPGGRASAQVYEEVPPPPRWQPVGAVHFVLQGSATGIALFTQDDTKVYIGGELALGADVRLLRELHLRALLIGAAQGHEESTAFASDGAVVERTGTGFASGGLRFLAGVVFAPLLALRLGGELGFEGIANVGRITSYGGGLLEAAVRLTDEERLEIVAQLAVQSRGRGRWLASEPSGEPEIAHELAGRVVLGVGWVF